MSNPSQLDRLVDQVLASGEYGSREDVLTVAMELLVQLRKSKHAELERLLRDSIESLDRGEGIDIDNEADLRAFFDDIKREGREEYEATRQAS